MSSCYADINKGPIASLFAFKTAHIIGIDQHAHPVKITH